MVIDLRYRNSPPKMLHLQPELLAVLHKAKGICIYDQGFEMEVHYLCELSTVTKILIKKNMVVIDRQRVANITQGLEWESL